MSIELAAVLSTITSPPAQKYWLPTDKTREPVPSCIKDIKPDYIIILPWNLKDEIQEDLSYISNWGGKFVSFE